MFIDQGEKQSQTDSSIETLSFFNSKKNLIILGSVLLLIFIIAIAVMFFISQNRRETIRPNINNNVATTTEESQNATSTFLTGLPNDIGNGNGDIDVTLVDGERGEILSFGSFYKEIKDDFSYNLDTYELPLNIKTDVANYYDISRKIDLESSVDKLNNQGFDVINNPLKANNFYSAFDYLSSQNIPVFVSSDFILYHQQNIFKKVFKDIEANVFYDNLWSINYKMYKIAKARYEKMLSDSGISNDPVLEGARTELAFFATTLELLKPKENQVDEQSALGEKAKFTPGEATKFDIKFPLYLETQVNKEVALIDYARGVVKSPIFLYDKDYSDFQIPEEYQASARLNNFYLASRWLNSIFPLYYQGELCPNCLLDQDDWKINLIAASFITKDLSDNQDVKNQWAVIYKILSFFTGLRGDLNYLHYQDKLVENFGEDYKVEEIFSLENPERDQNLSNFQKEVSDIDFLEIEGALSRDDSGDLPYIGLQILADSYWPDKYILKQLNQPHTGVYLANREEDNPRTVCSKTNERCKGIGLDIINLVSPVVDNNYFAENSNYKRYDERANYLKNQLNDFSVYNWHSNNFWVNLDISRIFLNQDHGVLPRFMQTEAWRSKNLNTALGSWVNLQLPMDKFSYYTQSTGGLNSFQTYNQNNYIEPNLALLNELRANTIMLHDMLTALGVTGDTNSVSIELQDLEERLRDIEGIVKKELNNENFDGNDLKTIESFIKQYTVAGSGEKSFSINFGDNYYLHESINSVDLAIVINKKGANNFITIGPVFNYEER